jgi:hypothetical protein
MVMRWWHEIGGGGAHYALLSQHSVAWCDSCAGVITRCRGEGNVLRCIGGEKGDKEASHRKHTDTANWKRGGKFEMRSAKRPLSSE